MKELSFFRYRTYKNRPKPYYNGTCKQCEIEIAKWYKISKKYGVSKEQWEEMYEQQEGKCAICGKLPKKICVDHDHKTGKVRGLLCDECNRALGFFYDNIKSLKNAINYLEKK